jgi:hypothetical protein
MLVLPVRIRSLSAAVCLLALSPSLAVAEPAHQVEEEWLVAEIASTIAGGRVIATRMPAPAAGPVASEQFDLVMPDRRHQRLDLADFLWAPSNYVALARESSRTVERDDAVSSANELLSRLTTPRIEMLLEANDEISRALAANRPGAHDDAALLLAAFAFREAAGPFSDTRPALCAITAHLAMARARGDTAGRNARAAELALLVLTGREDDAVRRLAEWENTAGKGSAERSWIGALRLRATGDWRALQDPAHASLLERLAYVRAVSERLGANRAMDFLDDSHPEDVADWTRLMTSGGMTVEAGDAMSAPAVVEELGEARRAWAALHPGAPGLSEAAAIVAALNETVPAGRATAISWPMFAASYQRHLAMSLVAAINHLGDMLGLKERARELARSAEAGFGKLSLYPLIKRYSAVDEAQYWEAMKAAATLWSEHPELVTSANWTILSERWESARIPENVPVAQAWFRPLTPLGTAYDAAHRIFTVKRSLIMLSSDLDRLRKLAPSATAVLFQLPRLRPAGKPPLARLQAEAGALAEYDLEVMRWLAPAAEPDVPAYRQIGRQMCELDANECGALAAYLADHDFDEEAAQVYQRLADRARDRVGMSTQIDWLVRYYERHGQPDRATALADKAADVYSYLGLTTKACLLEGRRRYDEAERLFKAAFERYSREPVDLAAFYLRRAQGASAARLRRAGGAARQAAVPCWLRTDG